MRIRARYSAPAALLMEHIGFTDLGGKLHKALEICGQFEKRVVLTGRSTGATAKEFGDYVMATVEDPAVESRWREYAGVEK